MIRGGVGRSARPPTPLINATATSAIATPARARLEGRSPVATPTTTGTRALTTAVIGATTDMAPLASA